MLDTGVIASACVESQRQVSADEASVIDAMEPLFAALFGWLRLNELLSSRAAQGGAMVMVAVLVSELKPGQAHADKQLNGVD